MAQTSNRRVGSHFTNPYNFVSWEVPVNENEYRRPYAPLDRYYGYTGRIECSLTTLTPFFVPSGLPEHQQKLENDHKIKTFLRLSHPENGNPVLAVQATSLKGMLRNVVEAATNSCYSVFDPDQRFSHRPLPKPLPLGLVSKDARGEWQIEKLDSARVRNPLLKELGDYGPLERAIARVQPNRDKPFLLDVTDIKLLKEGDSIPANYTVGWLRATGEGLVENKRNEKFAFRPRNKKSQFYSIATEVATAYNQVVKEQLDRGGQGDKLYLTQLSNYKLTEGDIVYFLVENETISALGPVAVPRYQYRHSVGKFLKDDLLPCSCKTPYKLCPACRLFGWVKTEDGKEKTPPPEKTDDQQQEIKEAAVMGRVFFSHAYIDSPQEQNGKYKNLAILGTPKPTTTVFYLVNDRDPGRYTDYNDKPQETWLRGRKFYWHYNPQPHQYLQRQEGDRSKLKQQNNQNSTVELLEGTNRFQFTIDFVNLDRAELGMLLWALEFDGADGLPLRHKLGMGKPLGLGSVHVQVDKLVLYDTVARYSSENLFHPSVIEQSQYDRSSFRDAFKNYMQKVFDRPFDELWNIRDLKVMLNWDSIANPLEVHYPHLPDPRQPELPDQNVPENFRWFVRNNRRYNPRRNTYPLTLPTPNEEVEDEEARLPLNP